MGNMTPSTKYEYPTRFKGKPTSVYHIPKNKDEPMMSRGTSPRICAVMRADQLYIRLGRSRIS